MLFIDIKFIKLNVISSVCVVIDRRERGWEGGGGRRRKEAMQPIFLATIPSKNVYTPFHTHRTYPMHSKYLHCLRLFRNPISMHSVHRFTYTLKRIIAIISDERFFLWYNVVYRFVRYKKKTLIKWHEAEWNSTKPTHMLPYFNYIHLSAKNYFLHSKQI